MFGDFKKVLNKRLDFLKKNPLFIVNVSREDLWDTYINSFPEELNPLYLSKSVHDCNCCKSWVRNYGGIVAIIDGKIVSIWDIQCGEYQEVANAMKELIEISEIKDIFLTKEVFGKDHNFGVNVNKVIANPDGTFENTDISCPKFGKRFDHFYYEFDEKYISSNIDTIKSKVRQAKDVIQRSFTELTDESVDTVLDLINSNSLYRGEEHKAKLIEFKKLKRQWKEGKNTWLIAVESGRVAGIRNSAIGTLLINLSEAMDLELAVKKYESVVAPQNYKRSTPIFTKRMKEQAEAKVVELGLMSSLNRRYATLEDIDISNVLWASGESSKVMKNAFDLLPEITLAKHDKATEVNIETFIREMLPNSKNLELMVDNSHRGNFVSLITGETPSLFQWENPFSWSYNGGYTDSIKEAVKLAGGNVEGILNFRLAWNEDEGNDGSDLDAWALEPSKAKIGYNTFRGKNRFSPNSGNLDVDNRNPNGRIAVENITWSKSKDMQDGDYKLWVNQYSASRSKGFTAQVEFEGNIHTFVYNKPVKGNVQVATVTLKDGKFTIKGAFKSEQSSKEIWGLNTQQFVEVDTVMLSPNYWGYNQGNKHFFFFIKNCLNDDAKGFYNEFLRHDLRPHRKTFEALSNKMVVPHSETQLSGLGFSSTMKNNIILKVDGRPIKVNFSTSKILV